MNEQKGDTIIFSGFSDEDIPDNGEILVEGQTYEIDSINEETEENDASVNLLVDNPNFDSKKRASKKNQKTIIVNVFPDEYTVAEPEAEAETAGSTPEDTVEFDSVKKGEVVTVMDTDGEALTGEIFKKTKTLLGILVEEDDGTEDEVVYKKAEVDYIVGSAEEEPEEEEEVVEEKPKPAPKKKVAKKKTVTKKKATKAKAKEEEPEEETKPETKPETKKKAAKKKTATKKKSTTKAPSAIEETDEDLKGIIILESSEEDEEVLNLVEESEDLCGLAGELAEEAAVQDYRLGGILYHVRVSKAFREVLDGQYDVKGGWMEYVETELGIGYRKAQYLIEIYTKWSKFGLDSSKVAEIGWTKAQEIARVMEESNADELVELASSNTVAELKETIKESFSKKGEDTREIVKKVTFKFRLTEEAGEAIESYLEQAADNLGLKKMEEVFEHVVSEWAQEHLDISSAKRSAKKK